MARSCCPILLCTSRPSRPRGFLWVSSVCICPSLLGLSSSVIATFPRPLVIFVIAGPHSVGYNARNNRVFQPGGNFFRDFAFNAVPQRGSSTGGFLAEITGRSTIPAVFAALCPCPDR